MEKYLLTLGSNQISWRAFELKDYFCTSNFVSVNVKDILSYFLEHVPTTSEKTKSQIKSFIKNYDELGKSKFVIGSNLYIPEAINSHRAVNTYLTTFNPYAISLSDYTWLYNQLNTLGAQVKEIYTNIYDGFDLEFEKKHKYLNYEERRILQNHSYEIVQFEKASILDIVKKQEVEDFKSIKLTPKEANSLLKIKAKFRLGKSSAVYGHQMGLVSDRDLAVTYLDSYNPFDVSVTADALSTKYLADLGISVSNLSMDKLPPNLFKEAVFNNNPISSLPRQYWVLVKPHEPSLMGYRYVHINNDKNLSLVENIEAATLYDSLEKANKAVMSMPTGSTNSTDLLIAQYCLNFMAIQPSPLGPNSFYEKELAKIEKDKIQATLEASLVTPISAVNIKNKI